MEDPSDGVLTRRIISMTVFLLNRTECLGDASVRLALRLYVHHLIRVPIGFNPHAGLPTELHAAFLGGRNSGANPFPQYWDQLCFGATAS